MIYIGFSFKKCGSQFGDKHEYTTPLGARLGDSAVQNRKNH